MRYLKIIFFILFLSASALAAKIENAEQLISAMHRKYQGKWYKTLTFAQNTTTYKPDGTTEKSVWYEAMALPGRLRIDFVSIGSGNGVIFENGSQHDFKEGKVLNSRRSGHLLLLLGFDVYGQPAETTLAQLRELKIDLTKFREDVYEGRAVYVVGADKNDARSRQFWIDAKNLYFLRSMQPAGKDGTRAQEIRFADYRQVKGGGWIAARVDFLIDGKLYFLEEYFDINPHAKLDESIFDPQKLSITSYLREPLKK